ncbi:MAG: hypothetical protein LCH63_12990 [Candidatus Melainabacteria bacterium]|jgi:hypothetical protein|nr:hypothetical protein [Candidatus Melainabacteria bacterium]OPZ83949.1 MAG: hypothetical protein BWY75_02876 [bacterium ADurb.Bin425]
MYFVDGEKTAVMVELFGGPLDGITVDCPLAPPPCFLIPTGQELEVSVYGFDCLKCENHHTLLKYSYLGLESVSAQEMTGLSPSLN